MKIYSVKNHADKYLRLKYGHIVHWVPEHEADIYHSYDDAFAMGQGAFYYDEGCEDLFDVIEYSATEV